MLKKSDDAIVRHPLQGVEFPLDTLALGKTWVNDLERRNTAVVCDLERASKTASA